VPPHVITRPGNWTVPYTIDLGATDELTPSAVFAHFNGAAASGAFLPCVTYYTQDGLVFARAFPADDVAAGASADVSWFPGLTSSPTGSTPGSTSRTVEATFDGGGATIAVNAKLDLEIGFAATITKWTLLADQSGSIVVNIWKDTYANYPPTVADKITASAPPTITTATKATDSTLTGWTTAINAGDTLRFNVDSVTSIQRVTLALELSV
jgi:hypothetical protein